VSNSILITGAGTGLGLETALYLAEQGFRVYATIPDLTQRPHMEAQAAERGVTLRILPLDVTDEASIDAAIQTILADGSQAGQRGRQIDGLINNAGLSLRGYFEDCSEAEIRRIIEVNLVGVMAVTRAVLPHMRAAGRGHLIFISSIGGRIASMARTAYCASKFGLEGFAESLMQELSPLGIRVSIVEPAIIKTERWTVHRGVAQGALNPDSPYYAWFQRQEALADQLVRTSPTTAADVAQTIDHLLSAQRPRLRTVVGWRAGLVLGLRRYLPGELFERFYFGQAMRRVAG